MAKRKKKNEQETFMIAQDRKAMVNAFIHDDRYSPMKEKELAVFLQVEKEDRNELAQILEDLIKEGQIIRNSRGRYLKSDAGIIGVFTSNSRGFGFVTVEGREEDIYIPEGDTGNAFLGDTVAVELKPSQAGRREEGRIIRIVMRGMTEVVGTYESSKTFGFVRADNNKIPNDIFVPKERSKGAVSGDKVVVEITDYGDSVSGKNPEGKVREIIGNINDPGVDILAIVKGYEIPSEFPERVMNQAMRTADEVSEADMLGRRDLRDVQMVTIDGEESKDLDDAVSVSVDEEGFYHLGVHIADVANYVQEGSALDREALKRGTSVYLVDRVIPMLPHKLSNGICSLNHGEDRLAMSCLMKINSKGEIVDHEIVESVINVDERMTYTSVGKIIVDNDEEEKEKYAALVPMFEQMYELAKILKKRRSDRGAIEFDSVEAKIKLDSEGNPVSIEKEERGPANELIEDFMLAANETVAQHFYWMSVPFVYRTHEQPSEAKIDTLTNFIRGFGYHLNIRQDEIRPMEIQKLLTKIEGSREESIISRVALRSMMQAKYTTECVGHFGLALQYYCHFTSPIRRYPDLQIHRIIKDSIRGRLDEKKLAHYAEILPDVAKHCSDTERRADDAERDTDKLKKTQYMEQHIGEVYEGVVSGVTAWGMFVELDNTCEGMIRLAELTDDYYVFDEQNFTLTGTDFGKEYRLGQKVKIKVVGADRLEKTVDFRIVDEDTDPDDIELKPAKKHYVLKLMEEEAARKSEQKALKNLQDSKNASDGISLDNSGRKSAKRKKKRNLDDISDEFEEVKDHYRSNRHPDLRDIDLDDIDLDDIDPGDMDLEDMNLEDIESKADEDDNLMTSLELREHLRKKRLIEGLEPDGRTGRPREKKLRSGNRSLKGRGVRTGKGSYEQEQESMDKDSKRKSSKGKSSKDVSSRDEGRRFKENGPKEKGHKKYKVHKYKKSATSKAARSSQKKKR